MTDTTTIIGALPLSAEQAEAWREYETVRTVCPGCGETLIGGKCKAFECQYDAKMAHMLRSPLRLHFALAEQPERDGDTWYDGRRKIERWKWRCQVFLDSNSLHTAILAHFWHTVCGNDGEIREGVVELIHEEVRIPAGSPVRPVDELLHIGRATLASWAVEREKRTVCMSPGDHGDGCRGCGEETALDLLLLIRIL